jgi:hypothetical protein
MPECAFCSSTAALSLEHVVSDWMNALFPGENVHLRSAKGKVNTWITQDKIDWTARTVCKPCNSGWMSGIEGQVKPILTHMIVGDPNPLEITPQVASGIARWVFKTCVVLDYVHHRGAAPWFPKALRDQFRIDQSIHSSFRVWICGVDGGRQHIGLNAAYGDMSLSPTYNLRTYICTGSIGNFTFQSLSFQQTRPVAFAPLHAFNEIVMPVWPGVYPEAVWPLPVNLEGEDGLRGFKERWEQIAHIPPVTY